MRFRINSYSLSLIFSVPIIVSVSFFSSNNFALYFLTIALTLLLFFLYFIEKSVLSICYLIVAFNSLMLSLVLFVTNGEPSYLSDSYFTAYYIKALYLEYFFWALTGIFSISFISNGGIVWRRLDYYKFTPNVLFLYLISLILISIEIFLNYSKYFSPYIEDTNIGTPLQEIASMILSIIIFCRPSLFPYSKRFKFIEVILVALILVVTFGSGKRLIFSFVLISYISHLGPKINILLVYSLIVFAGYVYGIFRDSFALGSFSLQSILPNLYFTNQGGALHASAVYLRLIDENILGFYDRFFSFLLTFVISLFVPLSFLPDISQLNIFAMQYYEVQGNGGLMGAYSLIYLGFIGLVFFPFIFSLIFKTRNKLFVLVSLILVISTMRWSLYNVAPLIRLIGYVVPIIFFLSIFSFKRSKDVVHKFDN
jgi:hypothetical protein